MNNFFVIKCIEQNSHLFAQVPDIQSVNLDKAFRFMYKYMYKYPSIKWKIYQKTNHNTL